MTTLLNDHSRALFLPESTSRWDFSSLWESMDQPVSQGFVLYDAKLGDPAVIAPFSVHCYPLEGGEAAKSLSQLEKVWQAMAAAKLDRKALVIACGGGTLTDLAGFAASTYMRGIRLVLVPTTLLGMVDSAIGGKNGINFAGTKNYIGTVYQPNYIIINPLWLQSLPDADYRQGIAEIIKYGIICDAEFFDLIEQQIDDILERKGPVIKKIIEHSILCKEKIVAISQNDPDYRDILNFGHTFAHAIESVSNNQVPHGEAVAIGMCLELRLSFTRGLIDQNSVDRVRKLLRKTGLIGNVPNISLDLLIASMRMDKKTAFGKICLILANKIGKVSKFADITIEEIKESIDEEIPYYC